MATVVIGINGFGRIGRQVLDLALEDPRVAVVAINDPFVDAEYAAYLIRHDSALRRTGRPRAVEAFTTPASTVSGSTYANRNRDSQRVVVDERVISVYGFSDPSQIPWADSKVQYVIDCSGMFTTVERASAHLAGGANRVIIAAPSADAPTLAMGANEHTYKPSWQVVSGGSCTAAAVAPVLRVLNDAVGVADCVFTSIHAATQPQPVVDGTNRKDYRMGRGALDSIIPTGTGAAKTLAKVLPALAPKVFATAVRVPVAQGSLIEMSVTFQKPIGKEQLDALFQTSSSDAKYGPLIGFARDPIVSLDIVGDTHSCTYDSQSTAPMNEERTRYHLLLWYDNEKGYAARLLDLTLSTAASW